MSTRKNKNDDMYIDDWGGLAEAMDKACKVIESQCVNCKNKIGTSKCKIFGERPQKYAFVTANVPCPKKEAQQNEK